MTGPIPFARATTDPYVVSAYLTQKARVVSYKYTLVFPSFTKRYDIADNELSHRHQATTDCQNIVCKHLAAKLTHRLHQ